MACEQPAELAATGDGKSGHFFKGLGGIDMNKNSKELDK